MKAGGSEEGNNSENIQVEISKKQLGTIQDSGKRSRVDVSIWDLGDI